MMQGAGKKGCICRPRCFLVYLWNKVTDFTSKVPKNGQVPCRGKVLVNSVYNVRKIQHFLASAQHSGPTFGSIVASVEDEEPIRLVK